VSGFDVDEFVAACRSALREQDRVGAVRAVLEPIAARPDAVVQAVGEPSRGSISTLHHAEDLTVLNIVWTPGMTMPPHDHRMLAGIAVYGGREDNGFWRRTGSGNVEAAGGRRLTEGDVMLLGDDIVHSVQAHPDRYTGGIHVYAGDFFNRVRSMWRMEDGAEVADPPTPEEMFEQAERRWRARDPSTTS
jgi:predicted metal-dependent enzyme (double-stranded beta helix superfamily)